MHIDKRRWSWYGALGVLGCIVLLLSFFSGFLLYPSDTSSYVHSFEVHEGDDIFSVAKRLSEDGIIESRVSFVGYALLSGGYHSLHPGVYRLTSTRIQDILSLITSPPQEKEITIFPGMSLVAIDELLASEGIIEEGSLYALDPRVVFGSDAPASITSLEGFIVPDTYRLYTGRDAETVARVFVGHFWETYEDLFDGHSFDEIYETLIVASLLEKEVVTQEDKEIVAGIIYKRYAVGMPLQIDASVLYGACGGRSCTPVRSMFQEDTPYNTYTRKGLPPTPIASPSVSSVTAARSPQTTSYWYYLSRPDTGETVFSETLGEHAYYRSVYLGL